MASNDDPRRNLASVSALLEEPRVNRMIAEHSRPLVLDAIHGVLDRFRSTLQVGDKCPDVKDIVEQVELFVLTNQSERLRQVINATGIILHTGLGRALLAQQAVDALAGLNRYCNLEIDLDTGLRGKRHYMTEYLLAKITGAEAAMVVNNNAGATLLILAALCKDREVIISRGQLIEIGGSYRLPDCIHQSGAIMVEVGTTNRTHLYDYEQALSQNTGIVLRVNPSNYRIVGFSQDVSIAELVSLKQKQPVIVVDDLGCGALVNLERYGLPKEPTMQDSIVAGADLVCSSGDKLIGGPQAGIIVGKKELIARMKKHPLSRMLRVCKVTDLALEHTLRLFLDLDTLEQNNPTLKMLATPAEALKKRALKLRRMIEKEQLPLTMRVVEDEGALGGGSLPTTPLKTYVLALSSRALSADRLSYILRQGEPPIIARIKNDEVLLDMRTLLNGDEKAIVQALARCAQP
jgi:L-seryl-tRNA(Ser) seleniumtransferase